MVVARHCEPDALREQDVVVGARLVGEALDTYIIVESGDSLWLIDKHAAHERIIYEKLNLKYSWEFVMFGTIFTDEMIRENAYKAIANGDISAHFVLSAMDGGSWLDKLSSMRAIKESGMLDMLIPPVTSYTMKQEMNGGLPPQSTEGGRPKETSSDLSDAKEKAVDAGTREL